MVLPFREGYRGEEDDKALYWVGFTPMDSRSVCQKNRGSIIPIEKYSKATL